MNTAKIDPFIYNEPIELEDWRPITDISVPGIIPGKYFISNHGRVYNLDRSTIQKSVPVNDKKPNQYMRASLQTDDGKRNYHLIHRIELIEFDFIDDYKEKQVNHKDGKKANNNIDNLEWTSASDNIKHAFKTGLKDVAKGEDCSYATITNKQARDIARLITLQKYTYDQIANIVGCEKHIVQNIASCQNWKSVCKEFELEKYVKHPTLNFNTEELKKLREYLYANESKYPTKNALYKVALKELFNIDYIPSSMSGSMSRYYNNKTKKTN